MSDILKKTLVIASALLLVGAGCDSGLLQKLKAVANLGFPTEAPKPYALSVGAGARIVVRPSTLGVSGTIADVLGDVTGAREVMVDAFEPDRLALSWHALGSASTTSDKGTLSATAWTSSRTVLPPALWRTGDMSITGSSLLWLSPDAYAELDASGTTDWHLMAGGLTAKIEQALKAFETVAAKLALTGSASTTSPFRLTKTSDIALYPLRVNGTVVNVEAIRVSSWFADAIVLKNPVTPLILNLTVKPASLAALKALSAVGVAPGEIGYEVTEVDTN